MPKETPRDVGDPVQVGQAKQKAKLRLLQEQDEMRCVLDLRAGRNVIWRILARCGVYHDAPLDPDEAARFNGRRSVGIKILEDILTADEKAYILMMREQDQDTD